MQVIYGDLFDYKDKGYLVIPVNIGWHLSSVPPYYAVMGKGIALIAANIYNDVQRWWGTLCYELKLFTPTCINYKEGFICFPTKPLDINNPNLSWKSRSFYPLIEQSAQQLLSYNIHTPIYLPLVGCGEGGLIPHIVQDKLSKILIPDNYYLVKQPE